MCVTLYVLQVANALWGWGKMGHKPSVASLSAILDVITANDGAFLCGVCVGVDVEMVGMGMCMG